MIYNLLAQYYDGLVKDDQASKAWVDFIMLNISGKRLLELACGSGEITLALANQGYEIDASDLSQAMIDEAMKKTDANKVNFFIMDMCNIEVHKSYDGVLCLCDSINYLLQEEDINNMFQSIYDCLNVNGTFIFDMHSVNRLEEFEEEFYEEGIVDNNEYTWSILAQEDYLYHNFLFYDENAKVSLEQHIQRVYSHEMIESLLEPYFNFEVYTDFNQKGIQEGEKYFYICRKKEYL